MEPLVLSDIFFFFNDTATTEIYTLSLHDALPILACSRRCARGWSRSAPDSCATAGRRSAERVRVRGRPQIPVSPRSRSEEHTSELQSRQYLVCRLLLEKKKKHEHSYTSYY